MARLTDSSLTELLDGVAAATPSPGGGTSAAVVAALGAALGGMAAAFGDGKDGGDLSTLADRAEQLRTRALQLAEAELTAYAPVLGAARLDKSDPDRPSRLAMALSSAADPPLEIARVAADAAELAARAAREGKAALAGDATTGALLAEAACRAAVRLVELDLEAADRVLAAGGGRLDDKAPSTTDPRLAEAAALAARAAAAREQALAS